MKRKLGTPKSTYRHNAQIGEYSAILTSTKKIRFRPSTHVIDEASFVKIASNSWQAEVIARSMSYQTPWTDKNSARNRSATKIVFKWTVTTVHSTLAVNLGTSCVRCPPTQYPTNNQPPSQLNISMNNRRMRTFYAAILCKCIVGRCLCSMVALFYYLGVGGSRWSSRNDGKLC